MHDLFYSQEQYDEYQRDLEGDGYSNEYQRCYAQSQILYPRKDESEQAKELTLAGKCVVMAYHERYCPVTDGFMHCDHLIERVCDSYEEAQAAVIEILEETAHGLDVGIYQLPPEPKSQPVPAVPDFDDSIPF
jgi:hypothetical protein